MPRDRPLTTFRRCVLNALQDATSDAELRTKLTECMGSFPIDNPVDNMNDPYAAMQRSDTEEYVPEQDAGKKSRRRRRHKSRRTRHKRKY